jgi:hypothetical protein
MTREHRDYDSTVARIAGNLLSGVTQRSLGEATHIKQAYVETAVAMARAIVEEVKRTEPEPSSTPEQER